MPATTCGGSRRAKVAIDSALPPTQCGCCRTSTFSTGITAGTQLAERQEIGQIESQKAEASLYAPLAGELVSINDVLLKDPSAINVDKYGAGWLFELATDGQSLLSPEQYLEHLEAVWEVTQRTIKGQMNK